MTLHGQSIIAGQVASSGGASFTATNPATGDEVRIRIEGVGTLVNTMD